MRGSANESKYFSAYRQLTGDHCPDPVKGFYNKKEKKSNRKKWYFM